VLVTGAGWQSCSAARCNVDGVSRWILSGNGIGGQAPPPGGKVSRMSAVDDRPWLPPLACASCAPCSSEPDVSVVVRTHNRAALLKQTSSTRESNLQDFEVNRGE
jgi:hypothetical protein